MDRNEHADVDHADRADLADLADLAGGASTTVDRMRADLTNAIKARDRAARTALRTCLAAVANAEAVPLDAFDPANRDSAEQPRRVLTPADVDTIVQREIAERHDAIEQILVHDRVSEAEDLRAEIAVLERYVPRAATPRGAPPR